MTAEQALPSIVVAWLFLLLAGGAAWWKQRKLIEHLEATLAVNEQARRRLAEQLLEVQRAIEAHEALRSAEPSPLQPPRKPALAAGARDDAVAWARTEPAPH